MYFDASGYKYRAWEDGGYNSYYIDEEYYLFDNQGIMQTNKEFGNRYYGEDGKAVRNKWVQSSGGYRYYNDYCSYYREGLVQMVQNMQILKKSMVNTMPLIRMVI